MRRTIKAEDWDREKQAFPFPCGELEGGILVTRSGVTIKGSRGGEDERYMGCTLDAFIRFAKETLQVINEKDPCREQSLAITKLEEALLWLGKKELEENEI